MPDPSDTDAAVAAVAGRRRGRKAGPAPVQPAAAPVPVTADEGPPSQIRVGRHVVAEQVYGSDGPTLFGQTTAYSAILSPGTPTPLHGDYVRASADVFETMIPPRAKTPVERLLWRKGWMVRRDVHDAVLAAHGLAVADGTAGTAPPAQFAPGEDQQTASAVALSAVAGLDSPPPPPAPGAPAPS